MVLAILLYNLAVFKSLLPVSRLVRRWYRFILKYNKLITSFPCICCWSSLVTMQLLGIAFILYLLKLSAGNGVFLTLFVYIAFIIINRRREFSVDNFNKQLFPDETVFRFRKDIGSPRKPGVGIYSPWEVSGCGGFVVMYRLLQETHTSLSLCVRGGVSTTGPQMISGCKWSQYRKWSPNCSRRAFPFARDNFSCRHCCHERRVGN